MRIRAYESRDAAVQAEIYNVAGRMLPSFKLTTPEEVERRSTERPFDPAQRFFAVDQDQPVGYCQYHPSGRISFPWCLPGHEEVRQPLLHAMLRAMKAKGYTHVFTAYRSDWEPVWEWFRGEGFTLKRTINNYFLDFNEMPTPSGRIGTPITPLIVEDLEELKRIGKGVVRLDDVAALRKHFFENPRLPHQCFFVERSRADGRPLAAASMILRPEFANISNVDSNMPCYRTGAFGMEGLPAKRINGLFSFLAEPNNNFFSLAYDLFSHAANLLDETELGYMVAQAPSDAPWLTSFYERHFKLQGAFPEYHRTLADLPDDRS